MSILSEAYSLTVCQNLTFILEIIRSNWAKKTTMTKAMLQIKAAFPTLEMPQDAG